MVRCMGIVPSKVDKKKPWYEHLTWKHYAGLFGILCLILLAFSSLTSPSYVAKSSQKVSAPGVESTSSLFVIWKGFSLQLWVTLFLLFVPVFFFIQGKYQQGIILAIINGVIAIVFSGVWNSPSVQNITTNLTGSSLAEPFAVIGNIIPIFVLLGMVLVALAVFGRFSDW